MLHSAGESWGHAAHECNEKSFNYFEESCPGPLHALWKRVWTQLENPFKNRGRSTCIETGRRLWTQPWASYTKLLNQLYLPCEISNTMTCLLKPLSNMRALNAKASPIDPTK